MVYSCGELLVFDDDETAWVASKPKPPLFFPDEESGEMFLKVTCPIGMSEGNTIIVKSPFGTRKVPVACPKGISPGENFIVKMPDPREEIREPQVEYFSLEVDRFFTPVPTVTGRPVQ